MGKAGTFMTQGNSWYLSWVREQHFVSGNRYPICWLSRLWLTCTAEEPLPNPYFFAADDWVLENESLRVVVDPETGDLCSVFDKTHQREVLSGGNQLQAFRDSGQYWDAWNIDPNYAQHPLPQLN